MRKPDVDPHDVQTTDVLCDFCHKEWNIAEPFIEGHQGACICGDCLTIAYISVILDHENTGPNNYKCTMCLETGKDREALDRGNEPAWQSPAYAEAVICKRCIKLASGALHKDKDYDWRKPE